MHLVLLTSLRCLAFCDALPPRTDAPIINVKAYLEYVQFNIAAHVQVLVYKIQSSGKTSKPH